MQWWNDFVDWFTSSDARPVLFSTAVSVVAIIVAALLAAWIARGAVKGMLARTDRQQKGSAIAALVDAAVEASAWNSLTPAEQVLSDRAVGQADILVRMLPTKGAGIAANWANHQLAEMKRGSSATGYQLDPAIAEFRDRMIEWQNHPGRARKIFQNDLERWRFETAEPARSPATIQTAQDDGAPNEGQYADAPTGPTATQRVSAEEARAEETRAEEARGSEGDADSTDTAAYAQLPYNHESSAIPVGAFANRKLTGTEDASAGLKPAE